MVANVAMTGVSRESNEPLEATEDVEELTKAIDGVTIDDVAEAI